MPYATRAPTATRMHYQVTGRPGGPPVLMIQGLGADKHGWDLQRLALALHATARRPRQPRRRAQRQAARRYTLEQMADDAIAVLDDAGVDTAHVVGRLDGRGHQPDPRRELPRAGALADARLHGVPQPPVAAGAAGRMGRDGPRSAAWAR